jgi:hypothetical protein
MRISTFTMYSSGTWPKILDMKRRYPASSRVEWHKANEYRSIARTNLGKSIKITFSTKFILTRAPWIILALILRAVHILSKAWKHVSKPLWTRWAEEPATLYTFNKHLGNFFRLLCVTRLWRTLDTRYRMGVCYRPLVVFSCTLQFLEGSESELNPIEVR